MNEQVETERDELDALLKSGGWQAFVEHVQREWGSDAYAMKMEQALARVPAGPDSGPVGAELVFQITATRREVLKLLQWPKERLSQIATVASHTPTGWSLKRRV